MTRLATALGPSSTLAVITGSGVVQLILYFVVLVALVKPLGWFMARVLEGSAGEAPLGLGRVLGWLERSMYALCGVRATQGGWLRWDGSPTRPASCCSTHSASSSCMRCSDCSTSCP